MIIVLNTLSTSNLSGSEPRWLSQKETSAAESLKVDCAMPVGTKMILNKTISFVVILVGSSHSPKDPASAEIFIFIA